MLESESDRTRMECVSDCTSNKIQLCKLLAMVLVIHKGTSSRAGTESATTNVYLSLHFEFYLNYNTACRVTNAKVW